MTKKSEFEKLLSETKLEINEVLDEKYSSENVSQIKQFDNISSIFNILIQIS